MLRRIFLPKRDKVTGGWRKLHTGELHRFYSSQDDIRIIKSRMMEWFGHVVRIVMRDMPEDCGSKSRKEETTRKT
jgi:hypothetical protein